MTASAGNPLRAVLYTGTALIAFSGNSVLCRLALGEGTIDPATFTTIRLVAGALTLLAIASFTPAGRSGDGGSWTSAAALFLYAITFSFAYLTLSTGTGALILFGAVQLTMIGAALLSGERPHHLQWIGLGLALTGLVYLVLPGLEAPSPGSAALMTVAGLSWGLYSVRGRGVANSLADTTTNFARTVPLAVAISLLGLSQLHVERDGVLLAIACGAVTSGLGYVVWYAALKWLTAVRAAVVQLPVPVMSAAGGVIFLEETVTLRLVVSALMVLGGIGLALMGRERRPST